MALERFALWHSGTNVIALQATFTTADFQEENTKVMMLFWTMATQEEPGVHRGLDTEAQ